MGSEHNRNTCPATVLQVFICMQKEKRMETLIHCLARSSKDNILLDVALDVNVDVSFCHITSSFALVCIF